MAADMDLFDDAYGSFDLDSSTLIAFPDMSNYKYSPAVPTMYEPAAMIRSDSASTNMGTVSPQELMRDTATFSAPNSTAFTNLTSPSIYNESPEFNDNFDVSPMFNGSELDSHLSEPWFPLFPEAKPTVAPVSAVEQSPLTHNEELEVADSLRDQRRRSAGSPTGSTKASSTSGVSKKRNAPLPPIVVEDPSDVVAIKRARNTLAARKSRQKKMERFDELENQIEELKKERDHWKSLALARSAAQN
jgi:hypothetical protein